MCQLYYGCNKQKKTFKKISIYALSINGSPIISTTLYWTTLLANVTNSNQYNCLNLCCGHDNEMRYLIISKG